jgi:hypothetical protein
MPRNRRPRARAASPVAIVAIVLAALSVSVLGVGRLIAGAGVPPTVSPLATFNEVTAQVSGAKWTVMDHDMAPDAPGYQMPPAMMPGMPTGDDQRLSVSITLVNTSDQTRPIRPAKEFVLHAGKEGKGWSPHSDTFGELPRLAPHNEVTGTFFFDIPPAEFADSPAWIEWTHDGTAARLTIPLDGAVVPEHSHNP